MLVRLRNPSQRSNQVGVFVRDCHKLPDCIGELADFFRQFADLLIVRFTRLQKKFDSFFDGHSLILPWPYSNAAIASGSFGTTIGRFPNVGSIFKSPGAVNCPV